MKLFAKWSVAVGSLLLNCALLYILSFFLIMRVEQRWLVFALIIGLFAIGTLVQGAVLAKIFRKA